MFNADSAEKINTEKIELFKMQALEKVPVPETEELEVSEWEEDDFENIVSCRFPAEDAARTEGTHYVYGKMRQDLSLIRKLGLYGKLEKDTLQFVFRTIDTIEKLAEYALESEYSFMISEVKLRFGYIHVLGHCNGRHECKMLLTRHNYSISYTGNDLFRHKRTVNFSGTIKEGGKIIHSNK